MPHELPDLPYATDALAPVIDQETMEIHHGKHHKAYIDKLNGAVAGTAWADTPVGELLVRLAELPEGIRGAVRNQGGGHYNHVLFWESLTTPGDREPSGDLASAIAGRFGSFAAFKEQFEAAGAARFGSGWVWLVADRGALEIVTTANQDNPVTDGPVPLLGNDVWEHAYYLSYRNRRPEYLREWWRVVDWSRVAARFDAAR